MLKIAIAFAIATLVAVFATRDFSASSDPRYSQITDGEVVEFFRTSASFDEAEQAWHIPVHGWVYQPEDSTVRKALFASIMKNEFGLVPSNETEANFTRRINLMIADNERDRHIVISMAGQTFVLPESAPNGHFAMTITLSASAVEKFRSGAVLAYSAVVDPAVNSQFGGESLLVGPAGLSIISDIDDTVKISNINDRRSLLQHTFLLDFAAVPGMAPLYAQWSGQGASLHFVSSSPWQLYAPLDEFLAAAGFPVSTLTLKAVRFRDKTLFDLFKKGTETKPATIEKILRTYKGRRFILVGDSGEHDPEVYAALLRKFPDQIQTVYIRNVSSETFDNDRFTMLFDGIDSDRWQLFKEADSIQPLNNPPELPAKTSQ
ncbi:MAG TPA: DUF2183 domain-containing protein [Woeseiaceae bacterium]|nr:DUF2183 domain-containing protein [Woeseiaceae bacterium]